MRGLSQQPAWRIAALAALLALLVVPAVHGSPSHDQARRAGTPVLDASSSGPFQLGEGCPMCLAGGSSRTLAAPRRLVAARAAALAFLGRGSDRPHAPAAVDLTRAAPRAPPSLA